MKPVHVLSAVAGAGCFVLALAFLPLWLAGMIGAGFGSVLLGGCAGARK